MSWIDEYTQQQKAVTPVHTTNLVERTKAINKGRKATEYDIFKRERRGRKPKDSKFRKRG